MNRPDLKRACARALALVLVLAGLAIAPAHAARSSKASKAADTDESLRREAATQLITAARSSAGQGERDKAIALYTRAASLNECPVIWVELGRLELLEGQPKRAETALRRALILEPNSPGVHEELGLMAFRARDTAPAREHLTKAVELDPRRVRALAALGVLEDTEGDHAAAMLHHEAALALQPGSAQLRINRAYSWYLSGELPKAEAEYRAVLAENPANHAALSNLGLLRARRGEYEAAVDLLTPAVGAPQAHNDVGYMALLNGDLETAARLLEEAIRLAPQYYPLANENLARVRAAERVGTPAAATAGAEKPDLPEPQGLP